jgi:cytochrome P450
MSGSTDPAHKIGQRKWGDKMLMEASNVPPHVSPALFYDFDVHHPPGGGEDYQLAWKRLHDEGLPDIIWTPRNGGHWVPLRGADIFALFADTANLSTEYYVVPKMALPFRIYPIQSEPDEHRLLRPIFQFPLFPRAVTEMRGYMRQVLRKVIEEILPHGGCEFAGEVSTVLPVHLFLDMVDLPTVDAPMILQWANDQIYLTDPIERAVSMEKISAYVREKIGARRVAPSNDNLSRIVHAQVGGRMITDDEAHGLCYQLVIGGLDTVSSMMSFIMHFLSENPVHRHRLANAPQLIPQAVDEFLRRFGLTLPGRVVRHDFIYKNIAFREGDMVILPTLMHGLDERAFPDPLDVDFNRPHAVHSTFGNGMHRCPGARLAKAEIEVLLEEWLRRIPEFQMKTGESVQIRTGIHGSITSLPLVW